MVPADITSAALELSVEDRLDLARRLLESVVTPDELAEAVNEGIRRIEDMVTGRVAGLTEEEFQAALK